MKPRFTELIKILIIERDMKAQYKYSSRVLLLLISVIFLCSCAKMIKSAIHTIDPPDRWIQKNDVTGQGIYERDYGKRFTYRGGFYSDSFHGEGTIEIPLENYYEGNEEEWTRGLNLKFNWTNDIIDYSKSASIFYAHRKSCRLSRCAKKITGSIKIYPKQESDRWFGETGFQGTGTVEFYDGTIYRGNLSNFSRQYLTGIYSTSTYPLYRYNRNRFLGTVITGQGEMLWPDGTKFEGEFYDWVLLSNGFSIEGEAGFPTGMAGYGTVTYPDGKIEKGSFFEEDFDSKSQQAAAKAHLKVRLNDNPIKRSETRKKLIKDAMQAVSQTVRRDANIEAMHDSERNQSVSEVNQMFGEYVAQQQADVNRLSELFGSSMQAIQQQDQERRRLEQIRVDATKESEKSSLSSSLVISQPQTKASKGSSKDESPTKLDNIETSKSNTNGAASSQIKQVQCSPGAKPGAECQPEKSSLDLNSARLSKPVVNLTASSSKDEGFDSSGSKDRQGAPSSKENNQLTTNGIERQTKQNTGPILEEAFAVCSERSNNTGKWWCDGPEQDILLADYLLDEALSLSGCKFHERLTGMGFTKNGKNYDVWRCGFGMNAWNQNIRKKYQIVGISWRSYQCHNNEAYCTRLYDGH